MRRRRTLPPRQAATLTLALTLAIALALTPTLALTLTLTLALLSRGSLCEAPCRSPHDIRTW